MAGLSLDMCNQKIEKLKESLQKRGSITVALSGGVDSIFLLAFAHEVLGDGASAVTAKAPNFASDEGAYAARFCRERGIRHEIVPVSLMEEIRENGKDRCYVCKKKLFTELLSRSENLADGTNLDDLGDYRPGIRALHELGIWSPLKEAGLTKAEIREELRKRNIDIHDKPAYACLASRVPYGEEITEEKLTAIQKVEEGLKELGLTQVRARHHGEIVRIEILPKEWKVSLFEKMNEIGKCAGFQYVTLDLEGYVMGRMNKA